jgi:hypothetical protein
LNWADMGVQIIQFHRGDRRERGELRQELSLVFFSALSAVSSGAGGKKIFSFVLVLAIALMTAVGATGARGADFQNNTSAIDAALAAAQSDVAAGKSPEGDCRRAETLVAQLLAAKTIDAATAKTYQSQIAFVRSLADDAALTVKLKQLDRDLSALEVKVSDERPKLRSPVADPIEARQLDETLWAAISAIGARLEVLPQDDQRVVAMGNRLAPLRDELTAAQVLLAQRQAAMDQGMNPTTMQAGMPAGMAGGITGGMAGGITGGMPGGITGGMPGGYGAPTASVAISPGQPAVISSVEISPPANAAAVSGSAASGSGLGIPRSAAEPGAVETSTSASPGVSMPIQRVELLPELPPMGRSARSGISRIKSAPTRLAWTLTGLLAAGLAYIKSRSPEQVPEPRIGTAAVSAWAIFLTQVDLLGLVLAILGMWWLCSAPQDGLVAAVALIACGLLAAGDVLTRRLGLSATAPQTARRFAGPTATAAAFIFALHLIMGGAGFI